MKLRPFFQPALFLLASLAACSAPPAPSDDAATTGSALTPVYAADFADGTPEAAAIVAVANDRSLTLSVYTKPGWEGGMYIDPTFAQAMIDRRGATDMFSSLVELNALPNARRDAFQKLFEWAKEKSPAYGYVWVSPIRKRLADGANITFWCAYTWWEPTTDPWGNSNGGHWLDKTGGGSQLATIHGNTLVLADPVITGDIHGSGFWAPSAWTFQLVDDRATWDGYGMSYSVSLSDENLTLSYSFSGGSRSSCIGSL